MNETNDASAMFAPIWRRKWLILAVGVLVAAGTFVYYKHKHPSYSASSQIYLGSGAEEQVQVNGNGSIGGKKNASPEGSAQAVLINSAIIKSVVKDRLRKMPRSPEVKSALAGKVKAKATEKSEFITLTAEARKAKGATLLADVTAQTYVKRQNDKYKHAVESAISLTRRQVRRITATQEAEAAEAEAAQAATKGKGSNGGTSAKGKGASTSVALQLAQLSSKINQLESDLGIVSVRQVETAKSKKLSTSPKRNAVFGFVVGLLLAAFVAYALARFDNRLRSLAEIEAAFNTKILAALAAVKRPIVTSDGQPRPSKRLREPLQRLHTALQVGGVGAAEGARKPRTFLFVSAQGGDGQSTVIADLALIQRDAGASVVVVEADLRRPRLARMLGVGDRPGLAEVLEGRLTIAEAIQGVPGAGLSAPEPSVPGSSPVATLVQAPTRGAASVLVGGVVENPTAALAGPATNETLRSLAEEFDYVLVDAPPPLEVSDVIPLLPLVDGIVIVARSGQTRDVAARRLMELLAQSPSAPVLGVVANGVSQKDIQRYGFSTYSGRGWRSRLTGP
ncbi:MAG TPA: Wzz/FepE/Etk N-terminal domain-containing protein [Solirubrobacteraceae bacterium]|jgi:Mrp family chromosome partitioning ATPase|nr:Wzz/FepE/Etk N-terminal domain-containing protein [Solirubrobacteraceae bacterium]